MGSGGNYATLTAAIADLNSRGISDAVTFSLTDASYSTGETFPLTINAITGSNSTKTVTIKPAATVNAVITGTNTTALLNLNGAANVIIDGSNTVGGTTKNLTIANADTVSGAAVRFINDASNNRMSTSR